MNNFCNHFCHFWFVKSVSHTIIAICPDSMRERERILRSFVTRETVRWFNVTEFLIERRPRITVELPLTANSPERPPLCKGPFFSSRRTKESIHWPVSTSPQPAKNIQFNWIWVKTVLVTFHVTWSGLFNCASVKNLLHWIKPTGGKFLL